jgi:tRNA pseudouridine38-40 synthase
MPKYKAVVEYDGTAYHGWQLQADLPTIQGALELALEKILGKPSRVHGSGRTDAGVHALGQVAHFIAEWSHDAEDLRRACNAVLPPDVAVLSLEQAADDFHARHSAHSKTYRYHIRNLTGRSPLQRLYAWQVPYPLDLSAMQEAADALVGSHDFAAFGLPTDGSPSTVREILHARWERGTSEGMMAFTVCGTGFLRYMVRFLVGTMVRVGGKRMTPQAFAGVLASCDRSAAGPTAPPHGLFLVSVEYGVSPRTRAR